MSVWVETGNRPAALHGREGRLVLLRVQVAPRLLEDLLETLAGADFPINPEIRHGHPNTIVEFPAYDSQVAEIRRLVHTACVASMELANMLSAIG